MRLTDREREIVALLRADPLLDAAAIALLTMVRRRERDALVVTDYALLESLVEDVR